MPVNETAAIGVIGGSGFYKLLEDVREITVETPYGPPSDDLMLADIGGKPSKSLPSAREIVADEDAVDQADCHCDPQSHGQKQRPQHQHCAIFRLCEAAKVGDAGAGRSRDKEIHVQTALIRGIPMGG